jgi:hypothetical protein
VQFEYLTIADSASTGEDGKVNALGLGVRIASFAKLPGTSSMAILASVSADVDEAGTYEIEVAMVEPDGSRQVIVQASAEVPADVADRRVPTGITFAVAGFRTFRMEGVHSFAARVGEVTRTYDFVVRLVDVVPEPPTASVQLP